MRPPKEQLAYELRLMMEVTQNRRHEVSPSLFEAQREMLRELKMECNELCPNDIEAYNLYQQCMALLRIWQQEVVAFYQNMEL
jgi:hypothetical protein